jgi:hypothetical protein
MSRSRRKSPVCGATVSPSDKLDKRLANRRVRRAVSSALQVDPERDVLPHHRELTDPWDMAKDGKTRFDPDSSPELMRK